MDAETVTWFAVDDQMHDHEKFLDIPPDAASLWLHAGSWSAGHRTDGFVPASLIRRWRGVSAKSAAELVRRGLWADEIQANGTVGWRFHKWAKWQPLKGEYDTPTDRIRWKRGKQLLRNQFLREQISVRDRNQCRYCGIRVNWSDRKSQKAATYDHVDPDGDNSLGNVVTACKRCNSHKKDLTPAEAGLTLLAPPAPLSDPNHVDPSLIGAEISTDESGDIRSLTREAGRGVDRAGSDLIGSVPDQVGQKPDPVLNGVGGNGNGTQV